MRRVSVLDFGAAPDREELQTHALQAAIDDVYLSGGGEVFIPAGRFRSGGLRLRSRVTLHLLENACLEGSRDCEDYMAHLADPLEPLKEERHATTRWDNALIKAVRAHDVSIVGEKGSRIDGRDCYDPTGEEGYRGPHAIHMFDCRGITLRGYTVVNSANWANTFFFCQNIDAAELTVLGGHDGFHVRGCDNVLLRDSDFQSGDDCLAGFGNRNVIAQRCLFNTACNGMRFGGTNVLVEDCRFYGPANYVFRGSLTAEEKARSAPGRPIPGHRYNMLSAFDYFCDRSLPVPAQPGHILLRNLRVENVDRLLQYNFSGNDPWQSVEPLRDVTFENVTATGVSMPLVLYGAESCPARLTIRSMTFAFREGCEETDFLQACHFERIDVRDVTLANARSRPLIRLWSEGEVRLSRVNCPCPEGERIGRATEPFFSRRI